MRAAITKPGTKRQLLVHVTCTVQLGSPAAMTPNHATIEHTSSIQYTLLQFMQEPQQLLSHKSCSPADGLAAYHCSGMTRPVSPGADLSNTPAWSSLLQLSLGQTLWPPPDRPCCCITTNLAPGCNVDNPFHSSWQCQEANRQCPDQESFAHMAGAQPSPAPLPMSCTEPQACWVVGAAVLVTPAH